MKFKILIFIIPLLFFNSIVVIAGSFIDNGNGTITDNNTNLIWQKEDDSVERFWEPAIIYCEGLSLAGYSDWRLPNIKELESITDDSTDPAINTTYFPNTKYQTISLYWSSTSSLSTATFAWLIDFSKGSTEENNKTYFGPYRIYV